MERTSDKTLETKSVNPDFILENIGELIVIIDNSSRYLYVSTSYCQLFCEEKTNLIGKEYIPAIHEDDKSVSDAAMGTIDTPPYTCYIERREKTMLGWRWIGWSIKAILGAAGDVESIVSVGRDITDKRLSEEKIKQKNTESESKTRELRLLNNNYGKITKELLKRNNQINELYEELRESEGRFRNMFAKHSSVMLLADPENLDIIDANLAAQRFYGYSEDEFLLKNLSDIYAEPIDKILKKTKKSEKGRKQYITSVHRLANGKKRDVEVHSVSIIYEREEVIFSIIHDVTSKVKTKKKLELSESKLREANNAKDRFFSIIAHDLKNPFNAILGLSDYIISNSSKLGEEKVLEFVKNINKVSNQTYTLLENLLQWAKTQMGKLEINIEAVHVNEIINDEVSMIKNMADSKEIRIIVALEKDFYAYADRNMIGTVVRNLLANAIKFSYRGGKIVILTENIKDKVKVCIIDEGEGIAKKSLSKIFDLDNTYSSSGTENEKGTGLGLIICKEFIEKCKGKIGVESIEGKGSRFYFKLPLVK